jgi:phospholipase/lecithinase/hemolysin
MSTIVKKSVILSSETKGRERRILMLKVFSRRAALIALGASVLFSPTGHAIVVDQMFVFGDSLSDSGNAAALTQVAPGVSFFPRSQPSGISNPVGLPYDYRFSNGPTAIEQLAGLLGTAPSLPAWPTIPDNSNPNFAVGGAMTGPGPTGANIPPGLQGLCCNYNWLVDYPAGLQSNFPAVQNTGMNNQIALFQSRLANNSIPGFDPARTLFSVWGGANDVFLALALASDPNLTAQQQAAVLQGYTINAAQNIGLDIGALALLGGRNFLVPNMPNLGETPFGLSQDPAMQGLFTGLSNLFNTVLDGALAQLSQDPSLDIIEFDTYQALDDLIHSGIFANTTQPCLDLTSANPLANVLGGCQGYLFFDPVHPTVATAAILAEEMRAAVPEPNVLALLAAALLALGWLRVARQRR